MCCPVNSRPGYSSLTNSLAQVINTNGSINFGHVVASSEGQNICTLDGNTLTVEHTGTYSIEAQVLGTPTAASVLMLSININGYQRAIVAYTTPATATKDLFIVRGVFYMEKGDSISLVNLGVATLTLDAATHINEYNVNTLIQRYN